MHLLFSYAAKQNHADPFFVLLGELIEQRTLQFFTCETEPGAAESFTHQRTWFEWSRSPTHWRLLAFNNTRSFPVEISLTGTSIPLQYRLPTFLLLVKATSLRRTFFSPLAYKQNPDRGQPFCTH